MLVQEISLKVDQGFINAMLSLLSPQEDTEESLQIRFQEDLKSLDAVLIDFARQSSVDEQQHFYDSLHISPLKVILKFVTSRSWRFSRS